MTDKNNDSQIKIVEEYYNSDVLKEWLRLDGFNFEFLITTHMMEKYIKTNAKILDIGGGPGRYALYFAKKGNDVTLVDIAAENIKFALNKAKEETLAIKARTGDARNLDTLKSELYDHVFVMGPMYHLFTENDRKQAAEQALRHLKPNGYLYISFISLFAGINYYLSTDPGLILKDDVIYVDKVKKGESFSGSAFTEAYFINIKDIEPFMNQFNVEKITLFGQEGITSTNEAAIYNCSDKVKNAYLELSEALCTDKYYLSHSCHIMYIGKKKE